MQHKHVLCTNDFLQDFENQQRTGGCVRGRGGGTHTHTPVLFPKASSCEASLAYYEICYCSRIAYRYLTGGNASQAHLLKNFYHLVYLR